MQIKSQKGKQKNVNYAGYPDTLKIVIAQIKNNEGKSITVSVILDDQHK